MIYDAVMIGTVQTLLTALIDYAGLFPPAGLGMDEAVAAYTRGQGGPDAFALNRFICPASRLGELSEKGRMLMPGTYATSGYREMAHGIDAWSVSVICDLPLHESLDAAEAFDEFHSAEDRGLARVDSLELRATDAAAIDDAIEEIPEDLQAFFEIPLDTDFRGLVAALAGNPGIGAKVRCGGVTAALIPPPDRVAAFLAACAAAEVPFKATAGLHHPVRAEFPLTYAPDAERATMHGYLNVFLAAALVRCRVADVHDAERILEETDPAAFVLTETEAGWRDLRIDHTRLARCRESFCLGYGSCSFTEPLDDLRKLGWL